MRPPPESNCIKSPIYNRSDGVAGGLRWCNFKRVLVMLRALYDAHLLQCQVTYALHLFLLLARRRIESVVGVCSSTLSPVTLKNYSVYIID